MPNDRNISSLIQALRGAPGLPLGVPLEELARHLADAGVIIPASLTDDQAVSIGANAASMVPRDRTEIALCVRQALEQIARGER